MSYFNSILCPDLGEGLVHKLQVVIPESGVWRFALCGSTFQKGLRSEICNTAVSCGTSIQTISVPAESDAAPDAARRHRGARAGCCRRGGAEEAQRAVHRV